MRTAIQLCSLFVKILKPVWRSSAYNFQYTAKYSNKMAKKTALLLIANGSEEMEAVITADVLRRGGVSVTIASLGDNECVKCSRDVKVCADTKFTDVSDKKYDVIILPGGLNGSKAFAESADVGKLLQEQEKENRLIAAICAAPTALKAHGIAKGKRVTSYPAMKDQMTDDYEYSEDRVVVDGNLITSRGPGTAFAFGLTLVEKLVSKETATTVAKGMLYEGRSLTTAIRSKRRVVVTGLGLICPLGVGVQHAWKNLLESKCGITKLSDLDYEKLPCKVAALIPKGDQSHELNIESYFSKSELRTMCPATAYALISSEEALSDARWKPEEENDKRDTGVAVGIGMIDLVDVCSTYEALKKGYSKVSPYFVPRILPNMAAGHISIKYGFRGPNHCVSTACATGAHAIGDAFRFIRGGETNVMVCGGAEACISPLAVAAFCRLRALSTSRNDFPYEASRPFDRDRDGFVMGEGSAILVLEELNHALSRQAPIYAEILGYGLSGDAAHITAPSEDGTGALLAMDRAVKDASIEISEITYVNAHATSTPLGDTIELKAVESLMGEHSKNVYISSTKGAHGHLLGAAGNLEAVFTIMAIKDAVIPPTINLHNLDTKTSLHLVPNEKKNWSATSRRIALKNAFGFGGINACLCFAEYIV